MESGSPLLSCLPQPDDVPSPLLSPAQCGSCGVGKSVCSVSQDGSICALYLASTLAAAVVTAADHESTVTPVYRAEACADAFASRQ